MQPFLKAVAHDLFCKTKGDLRDVTIVFPNKRAGLFFSQYLAEETDRPLWAPAYASISELFNNLSDLKVADPIELCCLLHQVFCQQTGRDETLDDFYFWGELLLADFDDIDKNLVEADRLFSNLFDLKELMDNDDFLDSYQKEAIQEFFHNFSLEKRTELKNRFIGLWSQIGPIYHNFRQQLQEQGIAYEGMMQRDALHRLQESNPMPGTYVMVGFNALNKVEHALFSHMKKSGKAMFYWDYDIYYTKIQNQMSPTGGLEAGEFITKNLQDFPNELPVEYFKNFCSAKDIRIISSPTENAQARYIYEALTQLAEDKAYTSEKENAVILCNETLLLPVTHSIPPELQNINITMGFPLAQTPVFSFINAYLELHTTGWHPDKGYYDCAAVLSLLQHPYTCSLSTQADALKEELASDNRFYPLPSELGTDDFLKLLFAPQKSITGLCAQLSQLLQQIAMLYHEKEDETPNLQLQLYRESLFKAFTMIRRMHKLCQDGLLDKLSAATFRRLVNRLTGATTIPFHGEPAIGLQIMGFLETRNLDFKNIFILSANEGQLPKSGSDNSFIPFNLRRAFGMTTIEHRDAIHAYYFYRLLQRAERITLMYNSSSNGLNKGEMSRFLLQLLAEYPYPITSLNLISGQALPATKEKTVKKTAEVMARLRQRFCHANRPPILSPSALNTYLDCRLKFYYSYVEGLTLPPEIDMKIDSALFGTIFHRSAELTYRDLSSAHSVINQEDIDRLLKNMPRLQTYVDDAFKEKFFHITKNERPPYNGTQLINRQVITLYLRQLLRLDRMYTPFQMVGMEHHIDEHITLTDTEGHQLHLRIGGTIDRMDLRDGILRIVDYKTGGSPKTAESIEQLFTSSDKRPGYIFQTFLYADIVCRKRAEKVAPALLYIHKASQDTYSPVIVIGKKKEAITDFSAYKDEFRKHLIDLLQEIFCSNTPFTQTENKALCDYCDFRSLCRR